ncbi:sigma-70 family RNA polymerase sigma factor [Bacteroides sp. OttesenSCG-928-E20]|nr:sigma-70 family RNA polymerase sigma factor [Bacteroides sp. OttesenSCG-928-E20]MDL2304436.1 sigma-70 family RNA polymerase sigma factor [Bacteroides sp. OttesenSCG-928-D19]
MNKLKKGKLPQDLEKLYAQYRPKYIAYVCKNSSFDKETAEDLFQDSFTAFCYNIREGKYEDHGLLESYFWRIGKNKLIDLLKMQGREEEGLQNFSIKWAEDIFGENELEEALNIVTDLLKEIEGERCAKILELFYWGNKKMEEIAGILGLKSKQDVKNRKARCMKILGAVVKERLKKHGIQIFK